MPPYLQGSIPYVPMLRAPFYVWVGRARPGAGIQAEARVEAPPMFPPTFLFTQSWEDPRADMQVWATCTCRLALRPAAARDRGAAGVIVQYV